MNITLPAVEPTTRQSASPPSIEAAILQTVAYVDVFDYPLTSEEIHCYLVGVPASLAAVEEVLANGRLVPDHLSYHEGYFTLPGREEIVATRRQRREIAAHLWPVAIRYGHLINGLPFVRMVAVTGSLAVNNVEAEADVDYLIVTENDRLWVCRALVILVVRLAARRGIDLCPNYFLSQRALVFKDRNLYTAHELVQMIPLAGLDVYQHLRRLNEWTADFLPNANQDTPPSRSLGFTFLPSTLSGGSATPVASLRGRRLGEAVLRTRLGHYLEQVEMRRKIRKFMCQAKIGHQNNLETAFSADWCKGHFDGHGHHALETFDRQLQKLDDL